MSPRLACRLARRLSEGQTLARLLAPMARLTKLKTGRLTQQIKTAVRRVRAHDIPKFGIITYVDATYLVKLPSYTYIATYSERS